MPELKIQTDRETLLRILENWDGATPSFAECVAGALLSATTSFHGDQFLRGVAGECKVAPSTIARWATGASAPHTLGQKSVVDIVAKRLEALLAARKPHDRTKDD